LRSEDPEVAQAIAARNRYRHRDDRRDFVDPVSKADDPVAVRYAFVADPVADAGSGGCRRDL
jgi:hypothetical protein